MKQKYTEPTLTVASLSPVETVADGGLLGFLSIPEFHDEKDTTTKQTDI